MTQAFVNAIPDAVAVLGWEGDLLRVNAAFRQLAGDDDATMAAMVAALVDMGVLTDGAQSPPRAQRWEGSLPGGERGTIPVTVTASPLFAGKGRTRGVVCIVTPRAADTATSVVEHVSDLISEHDADGTFRFATPSAVEITGVAADDLIGTRLQERVHPDDQQAVSDAFATVHATPSLTRHITYRIRHTDGTDVWSDTSMRSTDDGRVVCVTRDATIRVAAEREATARAERSDREADEQDALRRVAMAIAIESDSAAALAMVADEVSRLIGTDVALVIRFSPAGEAIVTAAGGASFVADDTIVAMADSAVLQRLGRTGETARGHDRALAMLHGESTPAHVVAAPVFVEEALWGAVIALGREGHIVPVGAERRLERFAELASVAVVAADTRTRLATQALTDPLTGLANHRAFHERLRDEVARARRYGRPLALALVDLDHFKRFNDTHGHQAGDRVLAEVARLLNGTARAAELVARVGGEEFAWLLPENSSEDARKAVERARHVMGQAPLWNEERMTFSAGVCDLVHASDTDELYRCADGALYWAKANGRNQTCLYSPEVVDAMSPEERAQRLERTRTLAALRSLARAVDAKDTSTNKHSVRVAAMAQRLAIVLGWTRQRAEDLRNAALLHDVGKLGIPDAILLKQGPLEEDEYAVVMRHAALGAEITSDVLSPEHCAWIRHHHEHWNGAGYPDGLAGEQIPEGSRIIAVADAWDVMTSRRPYGRVLDTEAAAAEVLRVAGSQFWPPAVHAILRVVLGPVGLRARTTPPTPSH